MRILYNLLCNVVTLWDNGLLCLVETVLLVAFIYKFITPGDKFCPLHVCTSHIYLYQIYTQIESINFVIVNNSVGMCNFITNQSINLYSYSIYLTNLTIPKPH